MGDFPGHPFRGNQYVGGGRPSLGDLVQGRGERGMIVAIEEPHVLVRSARGIQRGVAGEYKLISKAPSHPAPVITHGDWKGEGGTRHFPRAAEDKEPYKAKKKSSLRVGRVEVSFDSGWRSQAESWAALKSKVKSLVVREEPKPYADRFGVKHETSWAAARATRASNARNVATAKLVRSVKKHAGEGKVKLPDDPFEGFR